MGFSSINCDDRSIIFECPRCSKQNADDCSRTIRISDLTMETGNLIKLVLPVCPRCGSSSIMFYRMGSMDIKKTIDHMRAMALKLKYEECGGDSNTDLLSVKTILESYQKSYGDNEEERRQFIGETLVGILSKEDKMKLIVKKIETSLRKKQHDIEETSELPSR